MTAVALAKPTLRTDASAASRYRPDPRTVIVTAMAINALVMGGTPTPIAFGAQAVTLAALAFARRPRLLVGTVLWLGVCDLALLALPYLPPAWWSAVIVFLGYWVGRFATCIAFGIFAFVVIRPGELVSGLRQLRVPQVVVIPVAVMLRFLPIIRAELAAVIDAMALRGLAPGVRLLLHPFQALEHIMVPLLASCSRIADELAASALLRGLGSTRRPSSMMRLAFTPADAALLASAAGLIAAHFVLVGAAS